MNPIYNVLLTDGDEIIVRDDEGVLRRYVLDDGDNATLVIDGLEYTFVSFTTELELAQLGLKLKELA